MHPKSLKSLFQGIPIQPINPSWGPDAMVSGIAFDSRTIQPGDLFVALSGISQDGHRYIPDAIERGAAAVVGTQDAPIGAPYRVPYAQVENARSTLAYLSAALYDFPGRKLSVIGVTGTDGKTTTSNLIYQILLQAGIQVGVVSTVSAVIGDEVVDTGFHVTTPEAPDVQRYLSQMVESGLTHVVLETTSHGLAQDRVTGVEFDIAVVTNITHEHLDYHGSFEAYRAAKGRLFEFLQETSVKPQGNIRLAVLNQDDISFEFLDDLVPGEKVAYSLFPGAADIWAEEIRYEPEGIWFVAVSQAGRIPLHCHIAGDFNISNCLAAVSAALFGLHLPVSVIQQGVEALKGIPGRMEIISLGQPFTAIVDFAHTPNALKRALETVQKMTTGKVIAVFGSAGLRDREKRRLMAEISARMADVTILTAEDPRTESLDEILAEMAGAAEKQGAVEGKNLFRIADRGEAIRTAVAMAQPGDLVVACGKGHEQSMAFGEVEYPWDDRTAMRAALSDRLGIPGPAMPFLPTQKK